MGLWVWEVLEIGGRFGGSRAKSAILAIQPKEGRIMKIGRPERLTLAHVEDIQDRLNRGELQKDIAVCYGCSRKTVSRFVRRHQLRRDNTHLNGTQENLKMLSAYAHWYAKRHYKILKAQKFIEVEFDELLSRFNEKINDVIRAFVPDLLRRGQDKSACIRTYFFAACENAAQDYRQELADDLNEREFDSDYEITDKAVPQFAAYCFDCSTSWKWSDHPKILRRGMCPYCGSTNGRRLGKASL